MISKKKLIFYVFMLFLFVVYCVNASWLRKPPTGKASLLAHRGVHQTFPVSVVRDDTCTAKIIDRSNHQYIENTHDSINAAFTLGAKIVEIDIRATLDDRFAVFHDEKLDCRTNAKGSLNKQNLHFLQSLDIGFGYTFDNGKSYPFRGLAAAKMPSLRGILERHSDKRFLLHLKRGSVYEANLLITLLAKINKGQRSNLMIYGANKSVHKVLSSFPNMKGYSRSSIKECLVNYALLSWSGFVPHACRNTLLQIPKNYAPYLWGWPRTFMSRMGDVGTQVILTGDYDQFSSGIDDISSFDELRNDYKGTIWTNKI